MGITAALVRRDPDRSRLAGGVVAQSVSAFDKADRLLLLIARRVRAQARRTGSGATGS